MDKNFKKISSCFKKSILKLSGVNLHMTDSKRFLLNFFTLEERTKAFSLTLFHSFTVLSTIEHPLHAIGTWNRKPIREPRPCIMRLAVFQR